MTAPDPAAVAQAAERLRRCETENWRNIYAGDILARDVAHEADRSLVVRAYLADQPPAEVLEAVESFESVDRFAWANSLDEYLRVGQIMRDYIRGRVGEDSHAGK